VIRYVVCGLTLAVAAPAAAQPLAPPDVLAEVLAYEQGLAYALNSRDRSHIESLLSEDFVLRGAPDVDRETWINNAMTYCWGDHWEFSNATVRLDDDVAVASLVVTFFVDPLSCQAALVRSLITDVWIRDGDEWRLRVRHSGPVPADSVQGQFGAVEEPPPIWSLSSELSFVATAGNASTRTIGLGAALEHRGDQSNTDMSISYVSNEAESETLARALSAYVRHGIRVRESLDVFGRVGYARDRFAGIVNRVTTEVGTAYTATLPRHVLTTEAAIGYTAERRVARSDVEFGTGTGDLRFVTGTGAILYQWRVRPGTDLRNALRAVADLSEAENWRGTNELALTVVLTRLLTLKVSQSVEYRNVPVETFRRTDMRTAAAFVVSWQRR
jgi:putative salt-induced outer membrane protein YdiY